MLFDGPEDSERTLLLAHGAGAPMDSAAMTAIARALGEAGLRVARFELGYMAARRSGKRRPPPRAEMLVAEYRATVEALAAPRSPVIGGKSMGGRVASMVADELYAEGAVSGLLCIGYPFHPPGRPDQLRTRHLEALQTPTLIVQGTRDSLGTREEVERYPLSEAIEILWLADGDHDLRPRKSLAGLTAADHLGTMAGAVAEWAARLGR